MGGRGGVGDRALLGAGFVPCTAGEQTLVKDLLAVFGPGMLVPADRNIPSHGLARDVLGTGAHFLWRVSASFALTPIQILKDRTYLAKLYPARKADGPPITVRVIEYTVHTTSAQGGTESSELFCLITDLLDIDACSVLDLACAYPLRWGGRDRDRPPQDRPRGRPAGAAQRRPRGRGPGDVGTVRRRCRRDPA